MSPIDRDAWRRLVAERFPPRTPEESDRDWEALKENLAVGQGVTGEVIARAPFGVWLDIGVGFPAEVDIIVIDDLTPERYRADDWCPIGSTVTAFVGGFLDNRHIEHGREVRLYQRPAGWWRTKPSP